MAGPTSCMDCGRDFKDGEYVVALTGAYIKRQDEENDGPYQDEDEWIGARCADGRGCRAPKPCPDCHGVNESAEVGAGFCPTCGQGK